MIRFIIVTLICLCPDISNAQHSEPKTEFGKSFEQMKKDNPNMKYSGPYGQGQRYSDCEDEGLEFYYIFFDGVLREYGIICETEPYGFAYEFYETMYNKFKQGYEWAINYSTNTLCDFKFSYFHINMTREIISNKKEICKIKWVIPFFDY